jgi:hypothetical protein
MVAIVEKSLHIFVRAFSFVAHPDLPGGKAINAQYPANLMILKVLNIFSTLGAF